VQSVPFIAAAGEIQSVTDVCVESIDICQLKDRNWSAVDLIDWLAGTTVGEVPDTPVGAAMVAATGTTVGAAMVAATGATLGEVPGTTVGAAMVAATGATLIEVPGTTVGAVMESSVEHAVP